MDGALAGHLGEVLVRYGNRLMKKRPQKVNNRLKSLQSFMETCFLLRCNNVLYIRGVEEEEEDGEMRE